MFTTPTYPNKRFNSVEDLNSFIKEREKTLKKIQKFKALIKEIKILKVRKIFPP